MHLPDGDNSRRLAHCFAERDYTVNGVQHMLGAVAASALERDELVPALRVLEADQSPLSLVTRLFLLASPVDASHATAVLGELSLLAGLIEVSGSQVRANFEIAPHQTDDTNWWIAADWPRGRRHQALDPEHVLGVGGASTLLAQSTVRRPATAALDIGTGCGIQALHLAQHTERVVATDISERCLQLARLNASLNDLTIEFRRGSLFDPVSDQLFDTIVTNPPFVIGSPAGAGFTYRDSGAAGDGLCGELVSQAHLFLRTGGFFQMLANWEIIDPTDWAQHPRQWLENSPLDAWVMQREVQDPAAYVATWLADAGGAGAANYSSDYEQWLSALETRGVVGIGFGVVTLRLGSLAAPIRVCQHASQPLQQPIGPDISRWFASQDFLAGHSDRAVLDLPLKCAEGVQIHRDTLANSSDETAISIRRTQGLAWAAATDEFGAQLLTAADGEATLGVRLTEVAARWGLEVDGVSKHALPLIRRLVLEGFLWLPSEIGTSGERITVSTEENVSQSSSDDPDNNAELDRPRTKESTSSEEAMADDSAEVDNSVVEESAYSGDSDQLN